jgi:hypothetical protein
MLILSEKNLGRVWSVQYSAYIRQWSGQNKKFLAPTKSCQSYDARRLHVCVCVCVCVCEISCFSWVGCTYRFPLPSVHPSQVLMLMKTNISPWRKAHFMPGGLYTQEPEGVLMKQKPWRNQRASLHLNCFQYLTQLCYRPKIFCCSCKCSGKCQDSVFTTQPTSNFLLWCMLNMFPKIAVVFYFPWAINYSSLTVYTSATPPLKSFKVHCFYKFYHNSYFILIYLNNLKLYM